MSEQAVELPPLPDRVEEAIRKVDDSNPTMESMRNVLRVCAEELGIPGGLPMPLPGAPLVLEPYSEHQELANVFRNTGEYRHECSQRDLVDYPLNEWHQRGRRITLWQQIDVGGELPYEPYRGLRWSSEPEAGPMRRLTMALDALRIAEAAWDLEDELRAQEKLKSLLGTTEFAQYLMTGSFLEYSERSRVHYLFRRLRPTVAFAPIDRTAPDPNAHMKILAVLCMHPLGYYQGTWVGAMVPTDDVIAHLLMMRGDEHLFWRRAFQHTPWDSASGL